METGTENLILTTFNKPTPAFEIVTIDSARKAVQEYLRFFYVMNGKSKSTYGVNNAKGN